MNIDNLSKIIGVFPSEEKKKRSKLFNVLEMAFPVNFYERNEGEWDGIDAALTWNESYDGEVNRKDIPCMVVMEEKETVNKLTEGMVDFGNQSPLDIRLHGQSLRDCKCSGLAPIKVKDGDIILASCNGNPIWVTRRNETTRIDLVSLAPEELKDEEGLRDQLKTGRFFSLLPLIHFIREITANIAWKPPKLRAAFIIDDPNIRFLSYSYVKFPELARHAEKHGYHVALSTIPLDSWWASKSSVHFFKENINRISLAIHGNNHTHCELLKSYSGDGEMAVAAQALRRIIAFEKRYSIDVSRVMVPPHGVCSEKMIQALLRAGFEAICVSRPFPWLPADFQPPTDPPLTGWNPADLIVGGMPVIPRQKTTEGLIFRAFLDQPMIHYYHSSDFASGLEILTEHSKIINDFGSVEWMSLDSICRSNFATRQEGNLFRIKMYSRKIEIQIPEEVNKLIVEVPDIHGSFSEESVCINDACIKLINSLIGMQSVPIDVSSQVRIEISLQHPETVNPHEVPPPGRSLWPVVRRFMTEGRDRIYPVLGLKKNYD